MHAKTVLFSLICLFLLFPVVVTASGATRMVGVAKGDFFKYGDITVSGNSTTAPTGYETFNQMLWMETNVTGVFGTNITGQVTVHYKNGTETTNGGLVDVDTGAGENLTIWFISANLGLNDTVYNSSSYSTATINNTASKAYLGGVRETNFMNITYFSTVDANQNYSENVLWYWDKSTGAFVELSLDYLHMTGANTTTWVAHMGITDASVWTVPEFPMWRATLVVLIGLTPVILVISKRRLLKTSIH